MDLDRVSGWMGGCVGGVSFWAGGGGRRRGRKFELS